MSIIQAIFVIVIIGVTMLGLGRLTADFTERRTHSGSVLAISTVQNGMYRWFVDERQSIDVSGWNQLTGDPAAVPPVTVLDEAQALLDFLPADPYNTTPPVITGDAAALIVNGLDLVGSDTLSMHWPAVNDNQFLELRIHGNWDERHILAVMNALPMVLLEDNDANTPNPAPPTAVASKVTTKPKALLLRVPHPGSQAVLSGAMRRYVTEDAGVTQGMIAPIMYEEMAEVEVNQGCGEAGAMTIDDIGVLMVCADEDGDGVGARKWRPMIASHFYCRDLRLNPADPLYLRNAPNMLPVVDVDWSDITPPSTAASVLRINAVQVGANWVCPTGFAPDVNNPQYCEKL